MRIARTSPVDLHALGGALDEVARAMAFHGGGLELIEVSSDGAVEVQFDGLCRGCMFRPLTLYGTIIPTLSQVPGVSSVRARGVRISEESAERLATALSFSPEKSGAFRYGGSPLAHDATSESRAEQWDG